MNDRWQEIERIYHAVHELDAGARAEYLAKACAGDDDLRREVESLLAQADGAGSFLESPAIEVAAENMVNDAGPSRPTLKLGAMMAHYRLTGKLGEGGMGEVYRARDTKLQRDVAIKILPQSMARDAQRMARFEREARTLASLNHPHIAAIHGLEESDGIRALVMELVEGETLAERLGRMPPSAHQLSPQGRGWSGGAGPGEGSGGSSLAIDDALPIAKQIAEALEYAHERGVIHRDLKPANVKITPEGTVKVLDFGLAKVVNPQDSSVTMDPANSPTLSTMATQAGMILGTASYMSPEQAKGQRVDRRCDIWAFGCVLYEMLAGQKPFEGETISEVLAAVITKDPDWTALPATTPPSIQRLIRRCLVKDARQRLRDIGEARITIEEALSGGGTDGVRPIPESNEGARRAPRRILPWALAAIATLAAVAALLLRPSPPRPPLRKFEINAGKLQVDFAVYPEISPDGKALAYISGKDLFVRNLDQLEPRKIYTLPQNSPIFWSPDSHSIAFADQRKLWRIPAAGGAPSQICTLPGTILSGAWGAGGTIYFSAWRGDIYEVPAEGGDARALGLHDPKTEVDFHDLSLLPGRRDLMFVVHLVGGHTRIEVLADGKQKTVFSRRGWDTWAAAYSPTGHLVFMRARGNQWGNLWAAPFSLPKLEVTGSPFLVTGDGAFPTISSDGTLLYVKSAPPGEGQLVWVSRSGKIVGTIGQPMKGVMSPALSPDGKRLAVVAQDESGNPNVYVLDLASGVATPLFSWPPGREPSFIGTPEWTRDGRQILFSLTKDVMPTIEMAPADGSGQPRSLLPGELSQVFPQGNYIAYTLEKEDSKSRACFAAFDEATLQVPDKKLTCLPPVSAFDNDPQISPDRNYVAFVATNSGQQNVYVTHFPDGNGRWQVSTNGGTYPLWSHRGDELFYVAGNELMSVKVSLHPSLSLGTPVKLFSLTDERLVGAVGWPWWGSGIEVSAGGQRFLMVQQVGEKPQPSLVVDEDWFKEFLSRKNQ